MTNPGSITQSVIRLELKHSYFDFLTRSVSSVIISPNAVKILFILGKCLHRVD